MRWAAPACWSTETHLAVDQPRGVISFLLTPGQAGDSPQMIGVLERIRVMHPGGPGLAGRARHPRDHPGPDRPSRPPQGSMAPRLPTTRVRRGNVQGPARRRMRHKRAQTPPQLRHPLRQTLRSATPRPYTSRHRPLASTTYLTALWPMTGMPVGSTAISTGAAHPVADRLDVLPDYHL